MPPAVLAWLDYSEADQRRAREIVAMFSQPESRDELGLGQIRDALSDTLFPGTSVLLTRVRYLLFVPWLYREGARRGRQGSQLSSWVDAQERRLIGALGNGGDTSGLIGGVVGERVQNLPSHPRRQRSIKPVPLGGRLKGRSSTSPPKWLSAPP